MSNKAILDADYAGYIISNIKDSVYENLGYIPEISETLDLENNKYELTVYKEADSESDGGKIRYNVNLADVIDIVDDEDALEAYLDECSTVVDYETLGQEYYEKAEKAAEDHFGCTNAFLEPSTQGGRGGVFLFADDMTFNGVMDFEESEEYIYNEDLEGFIEKVLSSFYIYNDEDDVDDEVYDGNANGINTDMEEEDE